MSGGVSKEFSKSSLNAVTGGIDHLEASCEVYNPHKDVWTEGPALPRPVAAAGVAKFLGTLYVIGKNMVIHVS